MDRGPTKAYWKESSYKKAVEKCSQALRERCDSTKEDAKVTLRMTKAFNSKLTVGTKSSVRMDYVANAVKYAIKLVALPKDPINITIPSTITPSSSKNKKKHGNANLQTSAALPVGSPKQYSIDKTNLAKLINNVQSSVGQHVVTSPSPRMSNSSPEILHLLGACRKTTKEDPSPEMSQLLTYATSTKQKGPGQQSQHINNNNDNNNSYSFDLQTKASSQEAPRPMTSPPVHRLMISPSSQTMNQHTPSSSQEVRNSALTHTNSITSRDRSNNPQTPSTATLSKKDHQTFYSSLTKSSFGSSSAPLTKRNRISSEATRTAQRSIINDPEYLNRIRDSNFTATTTGLGSNGDDDADENSNHNSMAGRKRGITDLTTGDDESDDDYCNYNDQQQATKRTKPAPFGISPFHREILRLNLTMIMDD
jgi:hypothetical protein